jgi:magnesium transporter
MIRSFFLLPSGESRYDLPIDEFAAALANPDGLLWVDFEATPPDQDEPILREIFGFHPLAIDDALQETHVPKIDDWETYLYIVLQAATLDQQPSASLLALDELDVFLGKNYMVTHHDQPVAAIERTWSLVGTDPRILKNGADRLLYRLVDEVIASFMPVVEHLDDTIDQNEDELFNHPSARTLENIFSLKRSVLQLRRIIGPQREVLNKLARDEYAVINKRTRIYFRDVYDHLVRLHEITESMRDVVSGTLDTYLSVINNRMNDIMKTLTLITTLFMPISFIASFFGMNYFAPIANLSVWTDLPSFGFTMLLVILTPIGMYLWMRRKGWFIGSEPKE